VESFFGRVAFEGEGFAEDVLGRSYSGLSVERSVFSGVNRLFVFGRAFRVSLEDFSHSFLGFEMAYCVFSRFSRS